MGLVTVPPRIGAELQADGQRITVAVPALDDALLICGTDKGAVVAFHSTVESAVEASPIFSLAMHHGAVNVIALSTTQMVATAGHDGVCCVVPLQTFFGRDGADSAVRLLGHSLPIMAACFFTDGYTVVSVSIDGRLLIHDVLSGGVLCDVRCGFPTRALALSADETCCYVAGKKVARIDLYAAHRSENVPLAVHSNSASTQRPGQRLYGWMVGDAECFTAPAGSIVVAVSTSVVDNTMTALFARSSEEGQVTVTHTATWRDDVVQWWMAQSFVPLEVGFLRSGSECKKRLRVEPCKEAAPRSLLWCSWQAPRLEIAPCGIKEAHSGVPTTPWAEVAAQCGVTASVALTTAGSLEEAKERGRRLQCQCDVLAAELREALRKRRKAE